MTPPSLPYTLADAFPISGGNFTSPSTALNVSAMMMGNHGSSFYDESGTLNINVTTTSNPNPPAPSAAETVITQGAGGLVGAFGSVAEGVLGLGHMVYNGALSELNQRSNGLLGSFIPHVAQADAAHIQLLQNAYNAGRNPLNTLGNIVTSFADREAQAQLLEAQGQTFGAARLRGGMSADLTMAATGVMGMTRAGVAGAGSAANSLRGVRAGVANSAAGIGNEATQVGKYAIRDNVFYRPASEVNSTFPEGWSPPYKPGTRVTEFTNTVDDTYVRVHGENNMARSWMMKQEAIDGLTPAQIQSKYALPELPIYMSEVLVPAGTRIRAGIVNPVFGGMGNATQYELLQRLPASAFSNTLRLGK